MPFSIGGPQYGLRDGKVGTWLGDGTYDDVADIFSVQLLSVSPQTESQDLEGDDTITATASRTRKCTVRVRFGGLDTAILGQMTGGEAVESGSGDTATKLMGFSGGRAPYIGLVGQALAEEGDGDTHLFIPKCKVAEPFEIKFEGNTFVIPELTLTAVVDENFSDSNGNSLFFYVFEHATATALALPPTGL